MTDYSKVKPNIKKAVKANDGIKKEQELKEEGHDKLPTVVTGGVKKRKRSLIERFVSSMIGPDGISAVTSYLSKEIVVPALKDILSNSISSGVNMMIYGRDGGQGYPKQHQSNGYSRPAYRPQTNYTRAYSQGPKDDLPTARVVNRSGMFRSEDYIIEDRNEALDVLGNLQNQCMEYGSVSLADFFDLIGIESEYVDNNYGWIDLHMASVSVARGGFVIHLPNVDILG